MADPLTAIFEQIKKYNKIIIHRHQRPDPDAIGSQVGLAEILRASFPYKQIYVGSVFQGLIGSVRWIRLTIRRLMMH